MAKLTLAQFIVFPAVFVFLIFVLLHLPPINQNPNPISHLSSSTPFNPSKTYHQTPDGRTRVRGIINCSSHFCLFWRLIDIFFVLLWLILFGFQICVSFFFKEKMSQLKKIEEGLARARAAIRAAGRSRNYTSENEEVFIPRGVVYRNPYAFQQ